MLSSWRGLAFSIEYVPGGIPRIRSFGPGPCGPEVLLGGERRPLGWPGLCRRLGGPRGAAALMASLRDGRAGQGLRGAGATAPAAVGGARGGPSPPSWPLPSRRSREGENAASSRWPIGVGAKESPSSSLVNRVGRAGLRFTRQDRGPQVRAVQAPVGATAAARSSRVASTGAARFTRHGQRVAPAGQGVAAELGQAVRRARASAQVVGRGPSESAAS